MTSALILSALVGIVMPLGDTAAASAQAATLDQVMPESSAVEPAPTEAPVAPENAEPAAPSPSPDASTEAPSSEEAAPEPSSPGKPSAAPRAQAAPLATPAAYGFTWTVSDGASKPMPGTEFYLDGPAATSGWSSQVSWSASYRVTDCIEGPCAADSMDQDPRPGVFHIDRLVNESGRVTQLSSVVKNQRYRLRVADAPSGYKWSGTSTERMVTGTGARPNPNPWRTDQWDFGGFSVEPSPIECRPGYVYSIKANGQLQRAVVEDKTARITDIGAPVGGSFNGLGIGSQGSDIYAYNRDSQNAVYKFDVANEIWVSTGTQIALDNSTSYLVGGAVDPEGAYWVGGFSEPRNGRGQFFQLWKLEPGTKQMKLKGKIDLRKLVNQAGSREVVNGDFAFDTLGNIYLVRGIGDELQVFRLGAEALKNSSSTSAIGGAELVSSGSAPFDATNGIAYDSSGKLFIGAGSRLAYLEQNAAGKWPATNLSIPQGSNFATQDLATCSFPPTVKLQKNLPDGRAFPGDQFALELRVGNETSTKTTTGRAEGHQPDVVGPVPVGIGQKVKLSETAASGSTAKLGNYTSAWECKVGGVTIPGGEGKGTTGEIIIPASAAGKEVLCTFKNTLMKVTKEADPKTGSTVNEGDIVNYTLRFDNSGGATPAAVNYRDFLEDVLDDATFYDPKTKQRSTAPSVSTSHSSLTHSWKPEGQWLDAGGTVPAGAVGVLTFPVKVLSNSQDSAERQGLVETDGFFLRNKLARGASDTPPSVCEEGLCTEHPINAWTVEKGSLPANDARLHKGGNVHYKVTATKANAQTTLNGLVLTDDLTHVFKSAGWAPNAAVPGGAVGKGVYLFNSDGRTIGLDGRTNSGTASEFVAVRDVAEPTYVNMAANGNSPDMRWIVTSGAPLNLPKEAERAEMWFAVVAAESPAGIPNPSVWAGQGNAPSSGWVFANYATGMAAKQPGSNGGFAPNECATGATVPDTSAAPNAAQPIDTKFPSACRTQHEVSQNYFTIRKDAGGAGVQDLADDKSWDPDPTGLWNMVGHEFEIRDTDTKTGQATPYPSVKLCRTDYDPYSATKPWNGTWLSGASAADTSRFAFDAAGAKIQQNIIRWNNEHPEVEDQLPVCGTIYPISSGGQKGRWRSENLEAGDYWLLETKAPNAQAAVDATSKKPRSVPGVQRLAQPFPFKIWQEGDGPASGESSMRGRGQLDVGNGKGSYLDRCNPGEQKPGGEFLPGGTVAERPTACVNPTGYLMLVKDPAPTPLPLTGGIGPWMLWGGGAAVLLIASAGIIWWRVRRPATPRHGA